MTSNESLIEEMELFHKSIINIFNTPLINRQLIELQKSYFIFLEKINDFFYNLNKDDYLSLILEMNEFVNEFNAIENRRIYLRSIIWHEADKMK